MKYLQLFFACFAAIGCSFAQEPSGTDSPHIEWRTFEEVENLVAQEPRKVLVDVYTDWCGWCKRMDRDTYDNPEVIRYINENFYAIKFNAEQRDTVSLGGRDFVWKAGGRRGIHELAVQMLGGKMSYPSTVFFDERLQMIQPLPGYLDPSTILPILAYFDTNAYRNGVPFDQFKAEFDSPRDR